MAQLGDHGKARALLRLARRRFGARAAVAQARCQLAEAEVCFATRELQSFPQGFESSLRVLEARGDARNALHGRLLLVRRALLLGRVDAASALLEPLELDEAPAALRAIAALCRAELQQRRVRAAEAAATLDQALLLADAARIPALRLEVESARQLAARPAARLLGRDREALLTLADVEALFAGGALIVDGCSRSLKSGTKSVKLARRPVLFALLEGLARHPDGTTREALITQAFGARRSNDTHRARLRVEIGRLRKLVRPVCGLEATPTGFRLVPRSGEEVVLFLPPLPGSTGALQALLADGQAWSTSALGLALGESQRNVQRSLAELEAGDQVRAVGRGRAQRWVSAPLSGFTTTLLLPLNVTDS